MAQTTLNLPQFWALSTLLFSFLFIAHLVQTIPSPFGSDGVRVTHSGPTNALWGHEKLVPEEEYAQRRAKRQIYYPFTGWRSPAMVSSIPPTSYQQNWIASEHNRYRRMVPATDMRMVYWNEELARSAQAHANTCDFRHSRGRYNIGENIWAAPYYDYSDAIGRWYVEVNNPWCGCGNGYKHCCGHYIQMVWAQTALVGCGYAQCNGVTGAGPYFRAVFVCHYNPQGNKLGYQAYTWARTSQERCSQCPSDQPACYDGLCYMPSNGNYRASTANQTQTQNAAWSTNQVGYYGRRRM